MKMLTVAGKDLLRQIRSVSFLAFGFAVPLLVTTLFYFAFGGIASGNQGFSVASTRVQVVNLDRPGPQAGGLAAGQMLVQILTAPSLANLLEVSIAGDPVAARAAVDRQEVGVAVLIPAGLTTATLEPGGTATVELYSDPTLTLGPSIVQSIVQSLVDYYAGSKIAGSVALRQLSPRGVVVDAGIEQALALQYARWAMELGQSQQSGAYPVIEVRAPAAAGEPARDLRVTIVSTIMAGMMAFYVFFTGASSAQTLLQEEEGGTLARIFTTPTPLRAVLGGRVLATYALLIVQVVVLLVASALVFGVQWGQPQGIGLVALGMIVLAASFGLFLTSLLRSSRQGGFVYGGLMTILGMVGMISIFGMATPDAPRAAMNVVSLFTPQGWAVRGWLLLLDGGRTVDLLPTVAVMLGLGAVFFGIGLLRFRKRFA
jgi:ABC-2 type transport system permease protein